MNDEFRTHDRHSAIDYDPPEADPVHRARMAVARRFPAAAERIMAGQWDNGPWMEKAVADENAAE